MISDPRLTQICLNVEEQRKWLVRTLWATEHRTPEDTVLLGVVDGLLVDACRLIDLIQRE